MQLNSLKKDKRNLLASMSLEEKLGQLTMIRPDEAEVRNARAGSILDLQESGSIHKLQEVAVGETRLGIPLLFALDVLHGYRTTFPIPLAEAAAMDLGLWEATAQAAARERRRRGSRLRSRPCWMWRAIPLGRIAKARARTHGLLRISLRQRSGAFREPRLPGLPP